MNYNRNKEQESDELITKNNRILRSNSAIMCIYFLALLITVFISQNHVILLFCIPCFLLYSVIFYISFFVQPSKMLWVHYAATLLYIISFVTVFGWEYGVQYLLFMMITIRIASGWGNHKIRIVDTIVLILIYISLYGYSRISRPLFDLASETVVYFQIIHILTAFFALFFCLELLVEIISNTYHHVSDMEKKLNLFVSQDPLTGLLNRRTVVQYMEQLVEQKRMDGKSNISVAVGDIDYFSKINDRYGHDCGDIIIKQLAYLLSQGMKDKGKIARWGGDQFLFIFENATGEDAYYYLTKIQQQIRSTDFTWNDENINLTMTYGLMEYNPEKSIDYCIVEADKKMYMGKESGRNTIIF